MKELIRDFIKKYCTQVQENETSDFVELMIDNHKCIEFEGVEYYVPDDNSFWNEDEELLQEFITDKFTL
jgi:hypothetical protein